MDDLLPIALINVSEEVTKHPSGPDWLRVTLRKEMFC